MGDITHPVVATPFVTGDVLDPERVSEGVYVPQSTPNNMAVMNGMLDEDNLAAGYELTHEVVRPGAMATAVTRGQTANTDYFDDFFQNNYAADNPLHMSTFGLTVVGVRFYVPYDCTLVMLSWHVGVVVDGHHRWKAGTYTVESEDETGAPPNSHTPTSGGSGNQNSTLLVLNVDGVPNDDITRRVWTGRRSMLGMDYIKSGVSTDEDALPLAADNWDTDQFNEPCRPDHRWWSGHFNIDSGTALTKGWHTASIRVTPGKWTTAGGLIKVAPHVRFKTCHITAIPIR